MRRWPRFKKGGYAMMGWLCCFSDCRWYHLFDFVSRLDTGAYHSRGLYQCSRCRRISVGRARGRKGPF